MREMIAFLSLFTLSVFLCPILCLSLYGKGSAPAAGSVQGLPETVAVEGEEWQTAEYIVARMAAMGVQGYQEEALKAIAVAEITGLLRQLSSGESLDGDALLSVQEMKVRWGDYWFSQYRPRMEQAVREVWGQYLVQADGTLAPAETFALSWGATESGVECPYDFTSNEFETSVSVPLDGFSAVFPDYKEDLTVKTARSGRVESVSSGGSMRTGEEVMALFSLPSPAFSLSVSEQAVFTVRGQGRGIGMSRYAANEAAKRGAGYEEILKTFFPETNLYRR